MHSDLIICIHNCKSAVNKLIDEGTDDVAISWYNKNHYNYNILINIIDNIIDNIDNYNK